MRAIRSSAGFCILILTALPAPSQQEAVRTMTRRIADLSKYPDIQPEGSAEDAQRVIQMLSRVKAGTPADLIEDADPATARAIRDRIDRLPVADPLVLPPLTLASQVTTYKTWRISAVPEETSVATIDYFDKWRQSIAAAKPRGLSPRRPHGGTTAAATSARRGGSELRLA